jgi:outer membrane protein W
LLILKLRKMKKLLLTAAAVFAFGFANAQEQTKEGKWVIEANTGSDATGSTAISFRSTEFGSNFNLGADGGYFIMDNLALKGGIAFGSDSPKGGTSVSSFAYKIGGQYYIMNKIPVGLDYTGFSSDGANASWVGVEGGYAFFLGSNVAITPKVRYNNTLDKEKAISSFQGLVGFSLFF